MADSDEEYERRRRDKFRRERSDYTNTERREGGDGRRGGGQWEERQPRENNWDRGGGRGGGRPREDRREPNQFREFDRNRARERFSPPRQDMSPPQMKRMRRDVDEAAGNGFEPTFGGREGGAGGHHGNNFPHGGHGGDHFRTDDVPTQPAMSTFKQFLIQQDDNITDADAITKYNEYKFEFKKTQINEFFLSHKDEEWFKAKYHPEECDKKKEDNRQALKKRIAIVQKITDMEYTKDVTCDVEKTDQIVKLLDAAVILMEDGTDFDLTVLDIKPTPPTDETSRTRTESTQSNGAEDGAAEKKQRKDSIKEDSIKEDEENDDPNKETGECPDSDGETSESKKEEEKDDHKQDEPMEMNMDGEQEDLAKQAKEFKKKRESEEKEEKEAAAEKKPAKRKREYSFDSGSESSNSSDNDSDAEPAPPGDENKKDEAKAESRPPSVAEKAKSDKGDDDEEDEKDKEDKDDEEVVKKEEKESDGEQDEEKRETKKDREEKRDEKKEEEDEEPRPRALHRTMSIFLRNLAPTITRQEVEAMCKRYPGFMRVALQDPQPERRFFRRGWVTFDRTVNIKDICWNLNNIRLRECEMGAIVNRELKQRVRAVNGLTTHKSVIRQDIRHAAKIIQNLDARLGVWDDVEEEKKDKEKKQPSFGLVSKNPVLKNITNYLVEEGDYEEEELLGISLDGKPKEANPDVTLERDIEFQTVLDRLILYLRLVHSFDFYSGVEYPNEDEMPHRCGIIHARGPMPPNSVKQIDLNEWMSSFESKLTPMLNLVISVNEDMAKRLGRKDAGEEVEKFVQANTQEVSKDKWLCPISGKKFKGPDFIRKHLFNKHAEKVEEVKKEVAYFNNYLLDPKRPQLPEHPGNRPPPPPQRNEGFPPGGPGFGGMRGGFGGGGGFHRGNRNGGGFNNYGNRENRGFNDQRRERNFDGPGRDRFPGPRRDRGRPDPRNIIEYRDLDAPDDFDIFS